MWLQLPIGFISPRKVRTGLLPPCGMPVLIMQIVPRLISRSEVEHSRFSAHLLFLLWLPGHAPSAHWRSTGVLLVLASLAAWNPAKTYRACPFRLYPQRNVDHDLLSVVMSAG